MAHYLESTATDPDEERRAWALDQAVKILSATGGGNAVELAKQYESYLKAS